MRPRHRLTLAAAAMLTVASCARQTALGVAGPAANRAIDTARWVDSTLATLGLRARVAQMVTVWSLGDYTSFEDSTFAEVLRWVDRDSVGGITISLGTPVEVAHKLNLLQRRSAVPLLVSCDLEPSLMRLESAVYPAYLLETGGATTFPPAMAIAATGRDEDAYDVARAIAREGRASGIHVNFAPVVDVNVNPNNPVIGTRSFGEDPARVARLSAAFVRGTRAGGLFATAKHFPGHGDTDVDSHVGLPVISSSPERLRTTELVPFRAAIEAGAELVMSAHIALPALGGDSVTPATLRPDVMGALLRDSLGFRGTTVTDALSMDGVGRGYSVEQAAVLSVLAGSDILLKPNDVSATIAAVVAAVGRGEITRERIDASVRRLLWMKARAGLATRREVSLDSVHATVGSQEHRGLARDVAARAVTLLRDAGPLVPVAGGDPIALVVWSPESEVRAGRALARELARVRPGTRTVGRIGPGSSAQALDSVARAVRDNEILVIAAFVRRVEGEGRATVPPHIAWWMDSIASSRRAIVAAFGNPYVLRQMPRAQAYLATFGIGDALEVAVARAVTGVQRIGGRSPVSLPGFFAAGDGLSR